jgi:hypothetical protein
MLSLLVISAILAAAQAADPWSQFMRSNRHDAVANMSITASTKPNVDITLASPLSRCNDGCPSL